MTSWTIRSPDVGVRKPVAISPITSGTCAAACVCVQGQLAVKFMSAVLLQVLSYGGGKQRRHQRRPHPRIPRVSCVEPRKHTHLCLVRRRLYFVVSPL